MSGPAGGSRRSSRPRHHQRPVGIRAAWIGGGLTVLGGVIAALIAIFGGSPTVVNVNIGNARQPSPAKSSAAVFRDDFCTTTGGWTLSTTQTGGHYNRCALHIYANGKNDIEFSEPTTAGRLPQDITIDVTARRILGSAAGDEFGIACRAGGEEGYNFIVQANSVAIYRYSNQTGINGRQPLAQIPAQVDMNASNQLRATCANAADGGAADLALWVNNRKLAEATDANDPLTSGTVALFTATTPDTSMATEAEFTDFAVTRLH